jgi:hypothetical protein
MRHLRLVVKFLLWMGIILLLMADIHATAAAQSVNEFLDPWMDTFYVNSGDTFNVPIYFGTNMAVRSAQFDVSFNPATLRLNSLTEGGFFSVFAQTHGATITITPALIDNQHGTASGFMVVLNGAPGNGPVGSGVLAILSFTALQNGKSQTNLSNLIILDRYNNPQPNLTTTGGVVWVGPPPQLVIDSLQLLPQGSGIDYGKTFGVRFTIKNIGGRPTDPTYAFISAIGALAPSPFPDLSVPGIAEGQSLQMQVDGYQAGTSPAFVTVGVAGDSSRSATYQFNLVSSSAQTILDASVGVFIEVQPDPDVHFGTLQLGENTVSGSINVRCNTNYQVDVSDSNPLTDWRLRQNNGTAFLDHQLTDPLALQAVGFARISRPGGMLLTGSITGQGGRNTGQNFSLHFFQTLYYADALLPPGQAYRLVLNFNGYVVQ